MPLVISEISIGDILLASLYCEARAKYIVIGKEETGAFFPISSWPDSRLSPETIRDGTEIVYRLHVLWTHPTHATYPGNEQGKNVTMSHAQLVAHYWSFDLDKLSPEEAWVKVDYRGAGGSIVG